MRKKKKYVVGYDNDWQCVYGKENDHFVSPVTLNQSKRILKTLYSPKAVIYELVPIKAKK